MANIDVADCIIHRLIKEQYTTDARVELRSAPLVVNASVERLIGSLIDLYSGRAGKGYGEFEVNINEYPVQGYIRNYYIGGQTDFLSFSKQLVEHLKIEAAKEQLATGGYVLIAKITSASSSYLLIAIITEVVGSAITADLNIVDSPHLDINHLRVAGRIDLGIWQAGGKRYISFIKSRGNVADYFKSFIGCNDILNPSQETERLVRALEQFADRELHESAGRDEFLESAYRYLSDLGTNESLSLAAISNYLWPNSPEILQRHLASEELGLSDGFVPVMRAARALVKFEGTSAYWKLTFDRAGLREGAVQYDVSRNILILTGIPDRLREELIEETRTDET